jgi:hypothetical protein
LLRYRTGYSERSGETMSTASQDELNLWSYEAIRLLQANNGRYRARDIISDLEKRIDLTPEQKSLNNSGNRRWVTAFRFHSIGLVKAGLVRKEGEMGARTRQTSIAR